MSSKKFVRGASAVCAGLCALLLGAESIAEISDYKAMVDGVLGGAGAVSGSAEAYTFMSEYSSTTEMLTARAKLAEQLAEEGCVLLKNGDVNGKKSLPLREGTSDEALNVTLLGSRAYTYKADGVTLRDTSLTFYGGITGSKIIEQTVTTDEGTYRLPVTPENAFTKQNININPTLKSFYSDQSFPSILTGSEGAGNEGGAYAVNEPKVALSDCGDYGKYSDAAIVVVGRCSGEGRDYYPGASGVNGRDGATCSIGLSDDERNLIRLANQISDNVVVLVNSAIAMEINELKEGDLADMIDSLMWIGLPGAYGMNGVTNVLTGKASPSGHLPDEYAVSASDSPAAQNYGVYDQNNTANRYTWAGNTRSASDDSHYIVMAEGIYTGYYYYETRYNDCIEGYGNATSSIGAKTGASAWKYEDEVAFSFGYGLSYTTFSQEFVADSLQYDETEKTISIDVLVQNTGDYAGKEVVQLYAQSPYTDYDKEHDVEKPAIQLAAFNKTETLQPGEEETVTLTVELKYLASYDKSVAHDGLTGGYILEKADYYFATGNGAHEALNNVLTAKGIEASALYLENGVVPSADRTFQWNPDTDGSGFTFDSEGVDYTYLSKTDTGATVSNRLEDSDYNYYKPNTVTFLSRDAWDTTFPVSYSGEKALQETSSMKKYLDDTVYEFTTGNVDVEFGVDHEEEDETENKSAADYKLKAYDDPDWDYILEQITFDEAWKFSPYGGTKCNAFTSVNIPEAWQIDGPNGNVNRGYSTLAPTTGVMAVPSSDPNKNYFSCDMPCEPMIGATFNAKLVEDEGRMFGEDNLWSRNPIMWAPGMNLHRCPFNSRGHEYYSEDALLTNVLGTSFVRGGVEKGSILAAKHFALNSQESYREGLIQFTEEQTTREKELRAFQGLSEDVNYVNADGNTIHSLGLMSSFSRIGVTGVNAHKGMMVHILREEWGFKGLISTDMVVGAYYFNPQDSVVNNVTFMATSNAENLLSSSYWADYNNANKVKNDPVMMKALYTNMHHYLYAAANSIILNGISSDTVITISMSYWQYVLIGGGITFGGLAAALMVAGILSERAKNRQYFGRTNKSTKRGR